MHGAGRPALVVGSGLGHDAEHVAGLGYETVGFDVAATAVATARRRFPDSAVRYVTANVLDPPGEWTGAFALDDPPPWPLARSEIDAFAAGELRTVRVEELHNADFPRARFWRAEYGRPAAG